MTRDQKQQASLARKYLREENRKWPDTLTPVPKDQWPTRQMAPNCTPVEVMRSKTHLAMVYPPTEYGAQRVSVCRTDIDSSGNWIDGMTWDDLMEIKRQIGHAESHAVEILPADADIVNVANMRHIWLLPVAPSFAWRNREVVECPSAPR